MPQVEIWENFSKRENSTKTPPTGGDIRDAKLKEKVSVSTPVFILNEVNTNISYIMYDYKYYFVSDIVIINSTQAEYHCQIDVLATYKTAIQDTSAYALYYTHGNTELSDRRLGIKTTKSFSNNSASFSVLGTVSSADSIVVVSVVGENSVGSYALTQSEVTGLLNNFDNWYDERLNWPPLPPETGLDAVVPCLIWLGKVVISALYSAIYMGKQIMYTSNAPDKIKNAILLPLTKNNITGTSETVQLGKYETETTGVRITSRIFTDACTVNIPWQASDWRRNSPYHEIYLYIPYIGVIQISASDVMGDESIVVRAVVDTLTGDTVFTVRTDTYHFIGQYNTNIATNFPIGNSNVTPGNAVTTLATLTASVGAAIATSGASAALPATAGIIGASNQLSTQGTSIGSNSGATAFGLSTNVICYSIFHDTVSAPSSVNNTIGTPANKVISLSDIDGYVQTAGASVDCDAELSERQKINSMLDSGIYIE